MSKKISFGLGNISEKTSTVQAQASSKLGINLEDISTNVATSRTIKDIISEGVVSGLAVALSSCMVTDEVISEELAKISG